MKKQLSITLCTLLLTVSAQARCPEVTVKNLSKVACATAAAPYKTSLLSKMSYVAQTPCPSGVGFKKAFQGMFKGGKQYPSRLVNQAAGQAVCTYTLLPEWKNALKTQDTILTLTTSIDNPSSANYVHRIKCPVLTSAEFAAIETGGSVEVNHVENENVNYDFKVTRVKELAGAGARKFGESAWNTLSGKAVNLPTLNGVMKITKPFQQTCQYTHHTGGVETSLVLVGTQDIRQ